MQALDHQFIDNRWVASHGTRRLAVMDPYHERQIAEVTAGDARDVEAAVEAARRALPGWHALGGERRGAYLTALADALSAARMACPGRRTSRRLSDCAG
nr:aldehyde dehydrogenase family protein [Chromohalobacter japonicus]